MALEHGDVPVDRVALHLAVLILDRARGEALEFPIELVALVGLLVDQGLYLRTCLDRRRDGPILLVLEVSLGESVGSFGRVVPLTVGEEDVQHQRVRCGLDAHALQELWDREIPTEHALGDDGHRRRFDQARLGVQAHELVRTELSAS